MKIGKLSTAQESKTIRFTIPGQPMGAPRMTRSDKWKKRDCVVRYRQWKDLARLRAGTLPDASRVKSLSWTAYFAPSQSWSKRRKAEAIGQMHRHKPDRDNIDKAVLDALFAEDSPIACGTIAKYWDEPPRLEVVIELV